MKFATGVPAGVRSSRGDQVAGDGHGLPRRGPGGLRICLGLVGVGVVGELVGDRCGGRADGVLDVGVCLGPVAGFAQLGEGVLEGVDLRVQALCRLLRCCGLQLGGAAFEPGLVGFLRVRGHGVLLWAVHRF